jgi:predicted metal-dependent HD superfamily phosphohydrolase
VIVRFDQQGGTVPNRKGWDAIWTELSAAQSPDQVFDELVVRYSETHRAYHTLRHLDECFSHLSKVRPQCNHPAEIELAIWFHDAIYDPRSSRNEELSAQWAEHVVIAAGISTEVAHRVRDLVMATKHNATSTSFDACVLVDVDLSILGSDIERFDEYEDQVRREYSWVPEPAFRSSRASILKEFLLRSSIYSTEYFRKGLEARARKNIERSLARLGV